MEVNILKSLQHISNTLAAHVWAFVEVDMLKKQYMVALDRKHTRTLTKNENSESHHTGTFHGKHKDTDSEEFFVLVRFKQ